MATFLFNETVFGPVKSRRFGISLGVNLLPNDGKICSFDCVYCECGLNEDKKSLSPQLPSVDEVKAQLEERLHKMKFNRELPDVITFAGNGEPTMHPNFLEIMRITKKVRDVYAPNCEIVVLSNAMHLDKRDVHLGLLHADKAVLKIDSAVHKTFMAMNRPQRRVSIIEIIRHVRSFSGKIVLQTLFCSGNINGVYFDNTTHEEVDAWLKVVKSIRPEKVMIYTYSRDTPFESLKKADNVFLQNVEKKLHSLNITTEVTLNNEE